MADPNVPGDDDALRGFGVHIPFVQLLGLRLTRFEGGFSTIDYAPLPEHLNSFGVVHGGVVMTLLDIGMATASRSVTPGQGVVTIEMKSSFMRPSQGQLTVLGELMHRTATMAFAQARVVDAQGHTCAHGTGTFKYMQRLATGPRSTQALQVKTD